MHHNGLQATYFFDFMLNGFLVWFNVFLLNPNPGESFRGPLCGKTDYIKLVTIMLETGNLTQ